MVPSRPHRELIVHSTLKQLKAPHPLTASLCAGSPEEP
jgi:hypothetical protein